MHHDTNKVTPNLKLCPFTQALQSSQHRLTCQHQLPPYSCQHLPCSVSHPGKEEDEEQAKQEQGGEEAEGGTVAIMTSSLTYCIGGKNASFRRQPLPGMP